MGNNISAQEEGSRSSFVWQILEDLINDRTNILFDYQKMKSIADVEIEYYQVSMNMVRHRASNPYLNPSQLMNKFNISDVTKKLDELLYSYTMSEEHKYKEPSSAEIQKMDEEYEPDPQPIITRDIYLLDLVYRQKQCEYVISLMEQANQKLDYVKEIYEKEKYDLLERLKKETLTEVKANECAHNIWNSAVWPRLG